MWYNSAVSEAENPEMAREAHVRESRQEQPRTRHWIGLRGYLVRPYWGWLGSWAVLCGALASNELRWDGEVLLNLGLVLLLVELGWGTLWDLAVGTGWFRPLADDWPPEQFAPAASLPYTLPQSPGGRIARGLGRFGAWWREAFWPAAGPALLGLLAALLLVVILTVLLPEGLRPLNAVLAALIGLGIVLRWRGKEPLAAQALTRVGLGWLAAHAVLGEMGTASLVLALAFALAAWGNLRLAAGLPRSLWLLNAGPVIAVSVLIMLKQPVVAAVAGLLFSGQVAMQPSLRYSVEARPQAGASTKENPVGDSDAETRADYSSPSSELDGISAFSREDDIHTVVSRRTWPWLMLLVLLAAWALPRTGGGSGWSPPAWQCWWPWSTGR